MKNVLLIGRHQWVVDGAKRELDSERLRILGALSTADVDEALDRHDISHVFIGPGLDVETRLQAIRAVVERSDHTTVHLKDHSTGPEGGLNFVRGILRGLAELDA